MEKTMAKSKSRMQYAIKNTSIIFVSQVLSIIIQYVCRIIFVRLLETEYVGVNGLFSNILQILSLAELGMGSAITYSLYRPISENNTELIKSLMRLYKKTFYVVACVVFTAGFFISFRLDLFINETTNLDDIQLIFMLYVANSAASYLGTYKSTFISANQKAYVCNLIEFISKIILNITQIIVLIVTHNYILYLVVCILITITKNIVYICVANKEYPILKEKNIQQLPKSEKNKIVKNVKSIILHKIGWVVVEATDNILLSKLVSIVAVACYSNYSLIVQSISSVLDPVFNSLVASIGNLVVENDKKKNERVLYNLLFCTFVIYSVICVGICAVSSDFVELCFGDKYRLEINVIIVICVNYYLYGMRKASESFWNAMGLFYINRYAPIAEAVINIVASVILGRKYGIIGVLIGTTISTIMVPFWVTPYIVVKRIGGSLRRYFIQYFEYFMMFSIGLALTLFITSKLQCALLLKIILKGIISVVIMLSLIIIFYINNENFKWLETAAKNNIRR